MMDDFSGRSESQNWPKKTKNISLTSEIGPSTIAFCGILGVWCNIARKQALRICGASRFLFSDIGEQNMGRSYMNRKVVRRIVNIAVEPEEHYPVCPVWPATLAAGNAIAGISARSLKQRLQYLLNQVDMKLGEVQREKLFTRGKL